MLESSPRDFAQAYAQYAAHGRLLPRPEGSFLMEFACGELVLYLVDRSGPYTPAGPAAVVVHGVTESWSAVPLEAVQDWSGGTDGDLTDNAVPHLSAHRQPWHPQPWADAVGRTELRGGGVVLARTRRGAVVDVGFPVILSRSAHPPYTSECWTLDVTPGTWLEFTTVGPLHGYLAAAP